MESFGVITIESEKDGEVYAEHVQSGITTTNDFANAINRGFSLLDAPFPSDPFAEFGLPKSEVATVDAETFPILNVNYVDDAKVTKAYQVGIYITVEVEDE